MWAFAVATTNQQDAVTAAAMHAKQLLDWHGEAVLCANQSDTTRQSGDGWDMGSVAAGRDLNVLRFRRHVRGLMCLHQCDI